MPTDAFNISDTAKVTKDRPDLRDLEYKPTLQPLQGLQKVPETLLAFPGLVRNQLQVAAGEPTGTCTAHALAAVIDILRGGPKPSKLKGLNGANPRLAAPPRVSAEMIYYHGLEIDSQESGRHPPGFGTPTSDDGLWSLRSAIKAFYHNGVCMESSWIKPGQETVQAELQQVELFREARKTPLGSYYRIQPVLNDYHAALNEVHVIYAAAEIHGGWAFQNVSDNKGKIVFDDKTAAQINGRHAFAIVGYTEDGFLVLNSWGQEWGRYKIKGARSGMPGVALWPYYDWAERILDGWVLRLGVSAPEAFKFSFGRQGLGDFLAGKIQEGSTPRHELLGHYVHIDDGEFVRNGAIPSTKASISATCSFVADRLKNYKTGHKDSDEPYKKVLLWLPGGSEGIKDILAHIASTKKLWKLRHVYPITAIWCSDLLDQASSILAKFTENAFENIGRIGPDLDARIERDARAIGRAVWRDVARSATSAARKDMAGDSLGGGAMLETYQEIASLPNEIEIHVVAEGTGAILMHRLLEELPPGASSRLSSLSLILPACNVAELKEIREWLSKDVRLNLLITKKETKRRLRYGRYGGSLLDLVQMTFVETPPQRIRNGKPEALEAEIATLEPENRIVGVMDAETIRREFFGLDVVELPVPPGSDTIPHLRDVTAGAVAIKAIQDIILGAGVATQSSEIATARTQSPYALAPLSKMPNDTTMPVK
jgi:hypothetical protein